MGESINHFRELRVYQQSLEAAIRVFNLTKHFPKEEKFAITSQLRRASNSICANLAEAWRKRRYQAAFIAKINDCEAEACEMQVWLEIAYRVGYIKKDTFEEFDEIYNILLLQLIKMVNQVEKWLIRTETKNLRG